MGGGPSQQQKDAAAAQANLANTQAANSNTNNKLSMDIFNKISPFATDLMSKGSPYYNDQTDFMNGSTARAALPARAALMRSLGGFNPSQPNGFKAGVLGDFNEKLAQGFDDNMNNVMQNNLNTRLQGANVLGGQQANLNPLGWSGLASGSNNSIMNAPLATPSPWAAAAGLAGSLGSSAITKF